MPSLTRSAYRADRFWSARRSEREQAVEETQAYLPAAQAEHRARSGSGSGGVALRETALGARLSRAWCHV